jgi:hypothetical protein
MNAVASAAVITLVHHAMEEEGQSRKVEVTGISDAHRTALQACSSTSRLLEEYSTDY